jgi:hypothetical protein
LHNEELRDLYSSPNIIISYGQVEEDEMGKACCTNEEKKNACRLLVGKGEGKRPLGRPRCRWVDNIRMNLERWDGVVWSGLVSLRIGTSGELL